MVAKFEASRRAKNGRVKSGRRDACAPLAYCPRRISPGRRRSTASCRPGRRTRAWAGRREREGEGEPGRRRSCSPDERELRARLIFRSTTPFSSAAMLANALYDRSTAGRGGRARVGDDGGWPQLFCPPDSSQPHPARTVRGVAAAPARVARPVVVARARVGDHDHHWRARGWAEQRIQRWSGRGSSFSPTPARPPPRARGRAPLFRPASMQALAWSSEEEGVPLSAPSTHLAGGWRSERLASARSRPTLPPTRAHHFEAAAALAGEAPRVAAVRLGGGLARAGGGRGGGRRGRQSPHGNCSHPFPHPPSHARHAR